MITPLLLESFRETFRKIVSGHPVWRQHRVTGRWYGNYSKGRVLEFLERFTEDEQRQICAGIRTVKKLEDNRMISKLNVSLENMSSSEKKHLRDLLKDEDNDLDS